MTGNASLAAVKGLAVLGIALLGLPVVKLLQDVGQDAGTKVVIGFGIGSSAAFFFLLQRAIANATKIAYMEGQQSQISENVKDNRADIEHLKHEAAEVEARIGDSRHEVVGKLETKIAEGYLELSERCDTLDALVARVISSPTDSPAGRALIDRIERLEKLTDRKGK